MKRKLNIWLVTGALFNALFFPTSNVSAITSSSELLPTRTAIRVADYDTGSPIFIDYWVDVTNGNDENDGTSPADAFRTLTAAWALIPTNTSLSTGIRVNIQPGTYTAGMMPNYWENLHGSAESPILIRGNGTLRSQVILSGDINMYGSRYVYFENLSIIRNGDTFHCELCDHILLRNLTLNGGAQQAQETIKFNQSQHIYIENSDISGAWDNAIDFVAVQYGHILNNSIHNAGDWCAYAKGGSAYLLVEGNTIYDCGTGGFTAGQGTGFQFMTAPWIQYEAYDIKIVNNLIYDTEGAGLGVNGGYNILMAYNTLYHVGSRSHVLEIAFGMRSCDGQEHEEGREGCQENLDEGGWGTTVVDNGSNHINIPNKNVYVYNNIIYNPPGFQSQWSHFAIYDQRTNTNNSSNAGPSLATTDDNLLIHGNVIWNGNSGMPLGVEDNSDACISGDSNCNETQLRADNEINTIQPHFLSPASADFHPTSAWISGLTTETIPDFTWDLGGVPAGNLVNSVNTDYENTTRAENNLPGALISVIETTSLSFTSIGTYDGYILESTETSSKGGTMNSTAVTFNLGDGLADRQYRAILHFDTSQLPDTAVIASAILKIRKQGQSGSNPFNLLGNLRTGIRKPAFGTAPLALNDFKSPAGQNNIATFAAIPVSGWYSALLNNTGNSYINRAGTTQFRLDFTMDDNDDNGNDFMKFHSGNAGPANQPQLIIEYYVPQGAAG